MTIWDNIRNAFARSNVKATDSTTWNRASMRVIDGGQSLLAAQPFNYAEGVRHYTSWIYAAASINATAVASTPLRLYVKSDPNTRKLWNTRKASRKSVAWLRGDAARVPSNYVLRKSAELGTDFEEVTDDHPLLRLLSVSNPYHNGHDLSVLRVVWQELTGNAYMHVVVDGMGTPTELWAMPPQWVEIIRNSETFISGYRYGAGSESKVTLAPDEVIHFRRPNPRDLWYGMGKLEAAWGAASSNAAIHEMDLAMYANHARPDWLMTVKGDAGAAELDRIEAGIGNKLRGPRRSGNFLVTTADIDLKPLQFPPKDLVGRADIVEEIAAVFGVPVSMLKANDPNLASAQTGFASWREMTVLPLCRMDEETLNQRLLPMFGLEGEAILAYDDPVPSNRQQDLTETQVAVAGGWMTPNEARAKNGFDPVDDPMADRLLVNGTPLGGPVAAPMFPSAASATAAQTGAAAPAATSVAPASVNAATAPTATAAAASSNPATQNAAHVWGFDKAEDCVSAKIRTLINEGYPQDQAAAIAYDYCGKSKSATPCGCEGKHAKHWTQREAWLDSTPVAGLLFKASDTGKLVDDDALASLATAVDVVFAKQVAEVVAAIKADGTPTAATIDRVLEIIGKREYSVALRQAFAPYIAASLEHGAELGFATLSKVAGNPAVAQLGWSSAELSDYVARTATVLSTRATTGLATSRTEAVVDLLGQGMSKGETVDELAKRVQDWATPQDDERSEKWRAVRVARTEAAYAASTAEQDAWRSTGLVKGKTWLLAPDPCEFCEAASKAFSKQGVALDDPFFAKGDTVAGADGGTYKLNYEAVDGPPLHPNCRCATQPVLVDDYENLAAEAERRIAKL